MGVAMLRFKRGKTPLRACVLSATGRMTGASNLTLMVAKPFGFTPNVSGSGPTRRRGWYERRRPRGSDREAISRARGLADEVPSARLKAMGRAWLDRSDPLAKEIIDSASIENERARQAARRSTIEEANRIVFERECKRDGIDPAAGISPALLRTLRVQDRDQDQDEKDKSTSENQEQQYDD